MEGLVKIKENEVYKQILKDSFGGVMFVAGTQEKYDTTEVEELWYGLDEVYRQSAGGIMKGIFNFLKDE